MPDWRRSNVSAHTVPAAAPDTTSACAVRVFTVRVRALAGGGAGRQRNRVRGANARFTGTNLVQ